VVLVEREGRFMTYRVRNRKRVAVDSIRGYIYQLLHTVKAWLELGDQKVLVAEGNEDIDELVVSGEVVVSAREIQVKYRRGRRVASGSKSVREKILHSMVAFAEYSAQGIAYQGVLLTNAAVSGRRTQIGKWLNGERPNLQKLRSELAGVVKRGGAAYTTAWKAVRPRLKEFVKTVGWVGRAGEEIHVFDALAVLVRLRAPQIQTDIAINALLRSVCKAISATDLSQRRLRSLDADIVLNDALLSSLAGAEVQRSGWTTTIWSHVASAPYTAVAVALFVLDEERYRRDFDDMVAAAVLTHDPATREELLERFVYGQFSFVAYVSLRRKKGPRGVRVCLRDVVRQSEHRHVPDKLLVEEGAPPWLDRWLEERWSEPQHVESTGREQLWVDLASALGRIVASDPTQAMLRLGTKLRWVHEVESEKYFTADRPTG
jgi:hypothetical protein